MNTTQILFKKTNSDRKRVRIFCILGHIDSGKTSVSDYLIGILSNNLCGTMKYMDTRLDEQEKQITMKTSCFTFFHRENVYHLLDTPGHLDFFHEIKQGILLSEGIILLVSTVKGIESQTLQIIKSIKKYLNRKRVILVLNKIDRLIVEKELDHLELYLYLKEIIHQINLLLDSQNYFDPIKDNVIFTSALDGWGFRLSDIVNIYSKRLPFLANPPPESGGLKISKGCFWGTYVIKKRKIIETEEVDKRIMFCSLILNDLTMLYNLFLLDPDPRLSEKEVKKMKKRVLKRIGITGKVATRLSNPKRTNRRNALKRIFQHLYPIKETLLDTIGKVFPPVLTYLDQGLHNILSNHKHFKPEVLKELKSASKSSVTLVYCIKFLLVPVVVSVSSYNEEEEKEKEKEKNEGSDSNNDDEEEGEEENNNNNNNSIFKRFRFIGLCKIFSGVLRSGDKVWVLDPDGVPMETETRELYMLQGNEVHEVSEVHAGNIFGIGGCLDRLETFKRGFIVKSSDRNLYFNSPFPIVRSFFRARISNPILSYSVEARSHDDFYLLLTSLKMLNKMDAAVQIFVRPTGENIIRTEGEVHMDRCLYDLRHYFFRNNEERFVVSVDPMVQFRETVVKPQIFTLEDSDRLDDEVEDLLRVDDLDLRRKAKMVESDSEEEEEDEEEVGKVEEVKEEEEEEVKEEEKPKEVEEPKKYHDDEEGEIFSDDEEEEEGEGEIHDTEEEEVEGKVVVVEDRYRGGGGKASGSSNIDSPTTDFFLKKRMDGERLELEKKSGLEVRFSKCFKRTYTIQNLSRYYQVKLTLKIYPPVDYDELIEFKKNRLKNLKDWKEYFEGERKDLFIRYLKEKQIREKRTNIKDENIMKEWKDQVWHIDMKNRNVLLNHIEWYLDSSKFTNYFEKKQKKEEEEEEDKIITEKSQEQEQEQDKRIDLLRRNDDKVIAGFLVGVSKGSICGESMTNCIFSIENIEFIEEEEDDEEEGEENQEDDEEEEEGEEKNKKKNKTDPMSNFNEIELINLVKDGILKCFNGCKRKLLEPIYKCFISVHSKVLKHCMKVIKKRRGKIIDSFQNSKNNQWNIEALVPVVESLGMINEMRDETSGLATIFMKFYRYSLVENEEIEDELISRIQKKKGMYVEKLVLEAEKQRTISKKK